MLWFVYEILFFCGILLASPYYLNRMRRRGGYANGFLERFGFFNPAQRARLNRLEPIWIHAVSVGEVNLALQLISKLRIADASRSLALSTTTSTGHALAKEKLPPEVPLFYYPMDSRFCFGRVHRLLQPKALLLIEAELWPNHLRFCGKRDVRLLLINARLSKRFLPRYKKFGWLFGAAFRAFDVVTLQSNEDATALTKLGFKPSALKVVGNLKYEIPAEAPDAKRELLLSDLKSLGTRPLLVAGSTHPGEEEIVADIFRRLKTRHHNLALAIAPRHAERAQAIAAILRQQKIAFVCRSNLSSTRAQHFDVLLLDTTGELKHLYERATVIFMGKSLLAHGGQNIIEPAIRKKAIIFGPHMENFAAIAEDFVREGAAMQVPNAEELERQIDFLLSNPKECERFGQNASTSVQIRQGAMERTLVEIGKVLHPTTQP